MDEQKRADHMTRQQMQNEAMIIQGLLEATMALQAGGAEDEAIGIVDLAYAHITRLNLALDEVNAPKGMN